MDLLSLHRRRRRLRGKRSGLPGAGGQGNRLSRGIPLPITLYDFYTHAHTRTQPTTLFGVRSHRLF